MISVVIPLYNKSNNIADTINSVLSQTYSDFEVIVVDDGSTDNSAEVVRQFDDIRIRLIQKENGGVCSARNSGIQEARGNYIALLDGDDQWDKDYLKEMVRMIEDFPACAMWGINFAEMYDGKLIHKLATGLPDGFRGVVENYFEMQEKQGRVSDLFCSSSVVIRKEVFDAVGMFDERLKYSEDIDMWYRIIVNYPVAFYDRYMCFYLYDAENRAMNRKRLLRYWLPYYADKYKDERFAHNRVFYRWIMRWCAVRIKHIYFTDPEQRNDAKNAMLRLDMSVLPEKYELLFNMPFCIGKLLYLITEYLLKLKNK